MKMALVFLQNRYLLVLTILIVTIGGISAFSSMPKLEDPVITNRNPIIFTSYPGASAEQVDALVTENIENALQEIAEIKKLESNSRANISVVNIELDDVVSNSKEVFSRIRDSVSDATKRFPVGVSKPVFDDKRGATAHTLIVGLSWTLEHEPNLGLLNRIAKDLAAKLRYVPGTSTVRLYGEPKEELQVVLENDEALSLGYTPGIVAGLIRAADSKQSAGSMVSESLQVALEVAGKIDSLARLGNLPLAENSSGQLLRLADVATLKRGIQEPPSEAAYSNGKRAIYVAVKTESDVQVSRWIASARDIIKDFEKTLGNGVELEVAFDQTMYTNGRLLTLTANLLAGAGVVMLVIFGIMGWRSAIIVGLALPISLGLTLFLMGVLGGSIHQMSVFGILIALGLLIDNAIVIVDEVRKNLEEGFSRTKAVEHATSHLFIPLLASTLTTVLCFAPISLLSGNVGDFIGWIGGSVILALTSSFLLSMTVVPALAGLFLGAKTPGQPSSHRRGAAVLKSWLQRGLRKPLVMLGCSILFPLLGFASLLSLKIQFFPLVDRNMFEVRLWLAPETSLVETSRVAEKVGRYLESLSEVTRVDFLAGGNFPSVYYNQIQRRDNSPYFAHAVVTAKDAESVKNLVPRIQQWLDTELTSAQALTNKFMQGPPSLADIEFRLFGTNLKSLELAGDRVRKLLAEHPAMLHAQTTVMKGKPKLWVDADEDEVRLSGYSLNDISRVLASGVDGVTGGTMIEASEELPVRVRWSESQRKTPELIHSLSIPSPKNGSWIPLSVFGDVVLRPEKSAITRYNGEITNRVRGYIVQGALPIEVTRDVLQQIQADSNFFPPGVTLEVGGNAEQQGQAISKLSLYVPVLLTLVAGSLVLCFKSVGLALLLLAVAGLSVGLGLLATFLYGLPLSFNSMLGTAGLIGVALNDSIVVLAAIRGDHRASSGDIEAIIVRVMGSVRHVMATTFTTIGGFLPLLLFVGGDFWPPLAVVLAGGVAGATILAIFFVPSAYLLLTQLRPSEIPEQVERDIPCSIETKLAGGVA